MKVNQKEKSTYGKLSFDIVKAPGEKVTKPFSYGILTAKRDLRNDTKGKGNK